MAHTDFVRVRETRLLSGLRAVTFAAVSRVAAADTLPHIDRRRNHHALVVDDDPSLMLGAQVIAPYEVRDLPAGEQQ